MFHGLTINECTSWLNDVPRNTWYRDKIKEIVKNKVVFEVGCGSGILAAYCLEYGAKHYYGIDIRSHRAEYTGELLDQMGYTGKHTIFSGNFLDFPGIDKNIDVLLVEQTGNQYQNNFMNQQCWQHAKKIFPYDFVALPDQWQIDVEVYEGLISNKFKENCPSRFVNDPSLPRKYYNTVQKLSKIQPYQIVENAYAINLNNCFAPIEFVLNTNSLNNATFVLQDYISFQGDKCYTVSAVVDWPAPIVVNKKQVGNNVKFIWDQSLQRLPWFKQGYWKIINKE